MLAYSGVRRVVCNKTVMALLALCGLATPAAAYTVASSANPPTTQIVDIQLIDVCGPTGAGCAPTGSLSSYETFANDIFCPNGYQLCVSSGYEARCGGAHMRRRQCGIPVLFGNQFRFGRGF